MVLAMRHFGFYPKFPKKFFLPPYDLGGPTMVPPIFFQLPIVIGGKNFICVLLMVVAMRHFSFYPKFPQKISSPLWLRGSHHGSPDFFPTFNGRRWIKFYIRIVHIYYEQSTLYIYISHPNRLLDSYEYSWKIWTFAINLTLNWKIKSFFLLFSQFFMEKGVISHIKSLRLKKLRPSSQPAFKSN